MDVTFVSSNAGKAREVRGLLAERGIRVRWLRRRLPEPQADSLEEVVRAKLASVRDLRGTVLVEDAGLFIPALSGFPGVYSAHIYGIWRFGPILELLRHRDRAAEFRAVAAVRHRGKVRLFFGEVRGSIARRPRGGHGFGFDPIFVPEGERRTFAEMPAADKARCSHRARAVAAAANWFGGAAARRPAHSRRQM